MADDKELTGTDVLVEAMTELGSSDKQKVLVLIRDSNGDYISKTNIVSLIERMGLLMYALERQKLYVRIEEE